MLETEELNLQVKMLFHVSQVVTQVSSLFSLAVMFAEAFILTRKMKDFDFERVKFLVKISTKDVMSGCSGFVLQIIIIYYVKASWE